MVDARILHTTAALREAVLRLAADRPVSEITVADVTRAAGINRATFYSHAVSPGSLLADVLTPELDRIREHDAEERRAGTSSPAALTRSAIESVVEHVMAHRDIYRKALPDPNDASLHRLLVEHFTVSCLAHIAALDPDRKPAVIDEVAAGFVAQGFAGAIEAWIAGPRRSRKALVETIVLSFPEWWD
jgi:AcrR family transcriptional regulator